MNKLVSAALVLLVLILIIGTAGCINSGSEREVLRVGVGENFPPWAYPGEDGTFVGFDVEAITWIANQNNMDVEIVPLPWTDIVNNVADGTVDVIFCGLSITPARAEIIDFSIPYMMVNRGIAVMADSDMTMKEVMSGKVRVATMGGGTSHKWVLENIGGDVHGLATIEDAFNELRNGEVDAVVYDEISINRYVRSGPYKKIGTIESNESHGAAVRKGDTKTMDMINDGIADLRMSLEWQRLHTKYNIPYS